MATTRRTLPSKVGEGQYQDVRVDSYGNMQVDPYTGPQGVCDEGQYFVAVNPTSGTGISASIATAYSGTASAFIALRNNDTNTDVTGKRIMMDYIKMTIRTAPANATNWFAVIDVDNVQARFTSGGSAITPANANMASSTGSISLLNVGTLTTVALSGSGRTLGRIQFRTAIPVVGDTYIITFGGVDKPSGGGVLNGSNAQILTYSVPPMILNQNACMCVSVFGASNSATGMNAEFEMGWYER